METGQSLPATSQLITKNTYTILHFTIILNKKLHLYSHEKKQVAMYLVHNDNDDKESRVEQIQRQNMLT